MKELIAKLEAATEGSWGLSVEVCKAAGWKERNGSWSPPDVDAYQWAAPPNVTTSIDAALTLVPEGWRLKQLKDWSDEHRPNYLGVDLSNGQRTFGIIQTLPGGWPLAICIAALKARGGQK